MNKLFKKKITLYRYTISAVNRGVYQTNWSSQQMRTDNLHPKTKVHKIETKTVKI